MPSSALVSEKPQQGEAERIPTPSPGTIVPEGEIWLRVHEGHYRERFFWATPLNRQLDNVYAFLPGETYPILHRSDPVSDSGGQVVFHLAIPDGRTAWVFRTTMSEGIEVRKNPIVFGNFGGALFKNGHNVCHVPKNRFVRWLLQSKGFRRCQYPD